MTILVTGAAGFIGSNFVLDWFDQSQEEIISFDALTYAGNLENLYSLKHNNLHHFIQGNINDCDLVIQLLKKYHIRAIIHFAAESHVDRSIRRSNHFINTNIVGTYHLLESVRSYWNDLSEDAKNTFRFLHVSTDEVYGSLDENTFLCNEEYPYKPNNPYSASKAASNHLARAWYYTYGIPTIITHSSNNYGPFQYPEKLIPSCLFNALNDKFLTIYGDGKYVRDWLYVKDHCNAIRKVLDQGRVGEAYNIGGSNEKTNIEVIETLCDLLDELKPRQDKKSYKLKIRFVKDRPGHDKRYAMDSRKIFDELGWHPQQDFIAGLRKTIEWYLEDLKNYPDKINGIYQK